MEDYMNCRGGAVGGELCGRRLEILDPLDLRPVMRTLLEIT